MLNISFSIFNFLLILIIFPLIVLAAAGFSYRTVFFGGNEGLHAGGRGGESRFLQVG